MQSWGKAGKVVSFLFQCWRQDSATHKFLLPYEVSTRTPRELEPQ